MPSWAWIACALVLAPWVGVLGWLGVIWFQYRAYWLHKGLGAPPMTLLELVLYQLRELGAVVMVGFWSVRAAFQDGLRLPHGEVTGRPVLCVHGFVMNGSNFWGVRLALEAVGRPTRAVFLGLPFRRVRRYAPALVRVMRELVESHPEGIDVVAHSMGGTVLRLVLAEHPELAAKVHRIVTVGSPHQGTAVSRGFLQRLEPAARDLHRRSSFIEDLPGFEVSAPHALVTCIAARHDWVVYPRETALIEGTRHVVVEGVGHVGLLIWQSSIASVVEALTAPEWVQEREEDLEHSLAWPAS